MGNTKDVIIYKEEDVAMFNLTDHQTIEWLSKIELDLTTYCNLRCPACSRGCDKFPSKDSMMIHQVEQFVIESLDLNKEWKRIGLLGGEPTLHPNIQAIFDILSLYKSAFPHTDVWMMTNGVHKISIPDWVRVVYNIDHSYHHAFYVSPTDENLLGTNSRCESLELCGMGLGPYGYVPCVLGTAMARIFNYEALHTLDQCDANTLLTMCREYCQHCGWYLVDSNDRTKGIIFNYSIDYMSKTWKEQYERTQTINE